MRAQLPQFRLGHHHGQDRQGAVGIGGRGAHGIEPAAHVGRGDVRHAQVAEEWQKVAPQKMAVAFSRGRLPAPRLTAHELFGVVPEQGTVDAIGFRRL